MRLDDCITSIMMISSRTCGEGKVATPHVRIVRAETVKHLRPNGHTCYDFSEHYFA